MEISNLLVTNMLLNNIKINTGYQVIDTILIILSILLITYFSSFDIRDKFLDKLENIKLYFDTTNKIIFQNDIYKKDTSKKFKAIMHYISKSNDPTVNTLTEIVDFKYNMKSDAYEESKESIYRVDQIVEFNIDKDIKGKVYYREKKTILNGRSDFTEVMYLVIFSKTKTILELTTWVDNKVKDYETFIRKKYCDKQLLVEIDWNHENKDICVNWHPWESNVTFQNRFFENKDDIVNKINFFINNPQWYKHRGIPYTLGLLLHGNPGCGKTSFIKALMNLTGRHGINIKLNNHFDMKKLKEVIFDDEICDGLIIPQTERILIFEDVDCMGELVKDRDLKINENKVETIKKSILENKSMLNSELFNLMDNHNNNNLSFFLNILDGLHECSGRIIIMTTNKPNDLDKAIIRPGRIDYSLDFVKASIIDIQNTIRFYWESDDEIILDNSVNQIYSHAEIINFCRTSNSLKDTIIKINNNKIELI